MRITPNTPSYRPSYSKALLPNPAEPPKFAGSGDNWKKKTATVGLLTLSSLQGAGAGASSLTRTPSNSNAVSSVTNAPSDLPPVTMVDPNLLNVADSADKEKVERQHTADAKAQDAKKLKSKKDEQKLQEKRKADKTALEAKNQLLKRDADSDDEDKKVCRAPAGGTHGGRVVISDWWSTSSVSG